MTATRQLSKTGTVSDQRLFIAIPCALSPPVGAALNALRASPVAGLRPVNADTLHITLKFLGATPPSKIPAICTAIDTQCRDIAPFTLQLAGAGCFPNALWLGICTHPILTTLASRMESRMQTLGFQAETRAFLPHVTVARIKRDAGFLFTQWQRRNQQKAWGDLPVNAINLYRSVTTHAGAVYSVLHSAEVKEC